MLFQEVIEDFMWHAEVCGFQLVERRLQIWKHTRICGVEHHRGGAGHWNVPRRCRFPSLGLVDEQQISSEFPSQINRSTLSQIEALNDFQLGWCANRKPIGRLGNERLDFGRSLGLASSPATCGGITTE